MRDLWKPDPDAEATFSGRLDQGRRELSVFLRRDVSVAEIAERAGMTGAAISNHKKKGTLPTRENMRALALVFTGAGLSRYDHRYLEEGEPGVGGKQAEPSITLRAASGQKRRSGRAS